MWPRPTARPCAMCGEGSVNKNQEKESQRDVKEKELRQIKRQKINGFFFQYQNRFL